MQTAQVIKKVIAGVFVKDGKIMIAQRGKKDPFLGKWEFPGGKLEAGETEQECLVRELFEEFGIHAKIGAYIGSSFFTNHDGKNMELRAYFVDGYSGDFTLTEHLELRWVEKKELFSYEMPPADAPIVQTLMRILMK